MTTAGGDAARRHEVLGRVNELLWLFGTANDADDHHCGDEGAELRLSSAAELRALLRDHPFLAEVLPGLERELATLHIEGFGWSTLVDALAPALLAGGDTTAPERKGGR